MNIERHGPALTASPFRAYGPATPRRWRARQPDTSSGEGERILVACSELAARCACAQAGWEFWHELVAMPTSEALVNIVNEYSVPRVDLVVLP